MSIFLLPAFLWLYVIGPHHWSITMLAVLTVVFMAFGAVIITAFPAESRAEAQRMTYRPSPWVLRVLAGMLALGAAVQIGWATTLIVVWWFVAVEWSLLGEPEGRYLVWSDGTVLNVTDGDEPYPWMSDDYLEVRAHDEDDARRRAKL